MREQERVGDQLARDMPSERGGRVAPEEKWPAHAPLRGVRFQQGSVVAVRARACVVYAHWVPDGARHGVPHVRVDEPTATWGRHTTPLRARRADAEVRIILKNGTTPLGRRPTSASCHDDHLHVLMAIEKRRLCGAGHNLRFVSRSSTERIKSVGVRSAVRFFDLGRESVVSVGWATCPFAPAPFRSSWSPTYDLLHSDAKIHLSASEKGWLALPLRATTPLGYSDCGPGT